MGGYIGATAVGLTTTAADVQGDITSTDTTPELILKNTSEEDTEGGREGKITFKGEQSGGEESTLAQIESAHDGTSDDQKGDLIFKTNDGSDGASPTERMRIDSAGNVGIGNTAPARHLSVNSGSSSGYIQLVNTNSGTGSSNGFEIKLDSGGSLVDLINRENGDMRFLTNNSERMRIDSDGEVGIGRTNPAAKLHLQHDTSGEDCELRIQNANASSGAEAVLNVQANGNNFSIINYPDADTSNANRTTFKSTAGSSFFTFEPNNSEAMRIQSTGRLLIGKTSGSRTSAGCELNQSGFTRFTAASDKSLELVRTGSTGEILEFFDDSTHTGTIGTASSRLYIGTGSVGLGFSSSSLGVFPINATGGAIRDNAIDLGLTSARFDDVRATNGTIQTSDEREKQNIASLTDAEMTAAKAISKLFKTFKWKDKVAAKGDNARTHTGVIAQQVEQAMTDAGLTASNYAFWCSDTWWETQTEVAAVEADEENGIEAQEAYTRTDTYDTQEQAPEGATERNRKGIRYPELLSFIGAATEQRLTSIEARLDALEG